MFPSHLIRFFVPLYKVLMFGKTQINLVFRSLNRTFADWKAVFRPAAGIISLFIEGMMREESPGSIEHSTSENGSCWRQQDKAEENDRLRLAGKGEKVV